MRKEKKERKKKTRIQFHTKQTSEQLKLKLKSKKNQKKKKKKISKTEFEYSENQIITNLEPEEESKGSEYKKTTKKYVLHTTAKCMKEPRVKSSFNFNENSELADPTETNRITLNKELDYESTSAIFDRVYCEKREIYEEFCKYV